MPKVSFRYNSKRTRGKRKQKAKYRQQLLSTSTVAKIAKKVHRIEAAKERTKLINRLFLFPEIVQGVPATQVYNILTNEYGNGIPIDYLGEQVRLMRIRAQDIDFVTAVPPSLDDPLTVKNETLPGTGSGVGLPTQVRHGHRIGNAVKLTGCALDCRLMMKQSDGELETPGTNHPFGKVTFHWAIVLWKSAASENPATEPSINELLPYREMDPFGHSSVLDQDAERIDQQIVTRTLAKGKVVCRQTFNESKMIRFKRYVKLKNPIKFTYEEGSQNGVETTGWRAYFVCRSNVPSVQNPQSDGYEALRPFCNACVKMYYYDT